MIDYQEFKKRVNLLENENLNIENLSLFDENLLISVVQHRKFDLIKKFPENVFSAEITKKIFLFNNALVEKFPQEIRANKELMLPLLKINPNIYTYLSKEIQEDVSIFIEVLKDTGEVLFATWNGKNKIINSKNALKIVKELPDYAGYFNKYLKLKDWNEIAPLLIKNKEMNAFKQMPFDKVDMAFIKKIIKLSPSSYLRLKDNQQRDLSLIVKILKISDVNNYNLPSSLKQQLSSSVHSSLKKALEKNLFTVEKFISTYKEPLTKQIWDTFVFSNKFVKRCAKQNIDISMVKENFEETLRELKLKENLAKNKEINKIEDKVVINKKVKI